jgi:DNA-binding MarR family transcriptional regulator
MSNPSIDFCLSFHLAYSKLRLALDDELGTYHGINLDDFALLHSLASGGGTPTGLQPLATQLGTSRSALLRRLRPLEKIGLVAYSGGIADRRVTLRSPGHSLIQTAQDTIIRVCEKLSAAQSVSALLDGTRKSV